MTDETIEKFKNDLTELLKKYPSLFGTVVINNFDTELSASGAFGGSCMVCDCETLVNRIMENRIQHTQMKWRNHEEMH